MAEFFSNIFDNVTGFLSTLRFTDFIDIIVVAFIIYNVSKFIRDTRAEQLIKGLAAFGIIYLAADLLALKALKFILDIVVQYGVIALIVVFQPELRRILEKIGRNSISKIFIRDGIERNISNERKALAQIVKAVSAMSKEHVGALIVFERETKLGEIINTGTVINADSAQDLIQNIFYNKAPLHDGAMIVRDFRIYAAGCFLPLSQNYEISRELGTRHRAALGISENSDAISIIVSEETGTISVTKDGTLERNFDVASLTEMLEKLFIDEPAEKKSIFKRRKGGKCLGENSQKEKTE